MVETLSLQPLHPVLGAEVAGLDLRRPLAPPVAAAVERAMDRYAVLVFRDQALDDDQQMAFARHFGTIEGSRGTVDAHENRLKQGMNDISNLDVHGNILAADARRRMFNLGNQLWHSDSSFKAVPAK